jgi:hypothetical protein
MRTHRALLWLALATAAATPWPVLATALPAPLAATAEDAESLVELFLARDWHHALPLVDEIQHTQPDLIKLMREHRMPEATVDALRASSARMQQLAATEQQPLTAAAAANQITGITAELQSHYPGPVPASVARMDYLGREVVLLTRRQDQGAALAERKSELQQRWRQLAPRVAERSGGGVDGKELAAAMDRAVAGLQRDQSAHTLETDANRVLELVDALETLFVHAPAPVAPGGA